MSECRECQKEYPPREVKSFMGKVISLDNGYCPVCNDMKVTEQRQKDEALRSAEWATVRREKRLQCGIPYRYHAQDFSTFDRSRQASVWQICWDYAEQYPFDYRVPYKSLLLSGTAGLGKSHLSYSIAHRVLDRWNVPEHWSSGQTNEPPSPVLCVEETELYRRIQGTYNRQTEESEQSIVNRFIACPLLVLDDLGREKRTDMGFVQRVLFAVINGRYNNMRPMVVNTMQNQEQLRRYLRDAEGNEPLWDRLIEMTEKKFIRLEGSSYRGSNL